MKAKKLFIKTERGLRIRVVLFKHVAYFVFGHTRSVDLTQLQ